MIATVIRNLVSNAIKFTNEGGQVTVSAGPRGELVELTVADNGLGMAEEDMAKLFRLDTRHSTPGTANEKGTGLGLILCKEMVERNHGRIEVDSELGTGTTFRLTLPAAEDDSG
jgi:signal transduction histidine kinase